MSQHQRHVSITQSKRLPQLSLIALRPPTEPLRRMDPFSITTFGFPSRSTTAPFVMPASNYPASLYKYRDSGRLVPRAWTSIQRFGTWFWGWNLNGHVLSWHQIRCDVNAQLTPKSLRYRLRHKMTPEKNKAIVDIRVRRWFFF